jgi:RNA polymerase sigma factor (sigma-70 family)
MTERLQDCELLRAFVRQGDQAAFTAVVRRHLDLVFATALRKLEDPGAAEEVAQNVFAVLARKAWQFAPDDSLPAWLHRTTLLEAKAWLRGELRRRRREQAAAELGTTMKTPDEQPALRALVPLLDEALLSLREKDRTALLLRYYETQSLRDVGAALGLSEDAARKRVGTALDSLSAFFQRRGFRTATAAATAAALQHTAAAAPAAAVASISQAALQAVPAGSAAFASLLSRFAGLTKFQTAALCLVLAGMPTGLQWHQARHTQKDASAAQASLDTARTQQEELASEVSRLRAESTRLDTRLARAAEVGATAATIASKEDPLKARLFGLLSATDYRWPEDLPFVRIPKSAIKELNPLRGVDNAGHMQGWAAELLGLTPEEKQRVEETLRAHSEALSQMAAAHAYETNDLPESLAEHWAGKPHKSVYVPPLGTEVDTVLANLLGQAQQALGDERAQLLVGDLSTGNGRFTQWGRALGGLTQGELITVCFDPDYPGGLQYGQYLNGSGAQRVGRDPHALPLYAVPEPVATQFFAPWLAQFGITNIASRPLP